MLILAFITRTALPDCVCLVRHSSAGRVQVGARYGRQSYATSKLKDCRRTSRHSAYCWLIIYYGRLDCYCSFAKKQDKKMIWEYVTLALSCH